MKLLVVALLLSMPPVVAGAQTLVPPVVVQSENVRIDGDMKIVTVGNNQRHYSLFCSVKAAGCITPERGKNYLMFDAKTSWKMPGAKDFITLAWVQEWTVTYNKGENIGLVPQDGRGGLGIFLLDRTGGGYEQDRIFSDGPFIYGAGMSNEDRAGALKQFFMMMVDAAARQQGSDALGAKLARRCFPGQDSCTIAIDAKLVGVAGIQSPREVIVIVETDLHDPNKQLTRLVCTRPEKSKQVCRNWDIGKLANDDNGQ